MLDLVHSCVCLPFLVYRSVRPPVFVMVHSLIFNVVARKRSASRILAEMKHSTKS